MRYQGRRAREREAFLASGLPTTAERIQDAAWREAKFFASNPSIAAWMRRHPVDPRTLTALGRIQAGAELPDDLLVELNELALRDFF